jgi:hypothetical protein
VDIDIGEKADKAKAKAAGITFKQYIATGTSLWI